MLDVFNAQSSNQARRSVTFAVDPKSGSDSRSEGENDLNDKTPTLGTLTNPYDSGGLLKSDTSSGRDPYVCPANSGTQCHGPIAGEYHSNTDTPGHHRVHNGDRHANTSILDGNV